MATVRSLPTKRAAWGDAEHKAGLRETEALLLAKIKELGLTATSDPIDFLGGERDEKPWNNFVIDLPGKTLPGEVLVISAHFDAVANAPGAEDDGSGVAAIMEMARLLKDEPIHRTVRLILFNLEEAGLGGSRAYVGRNSENWGEGKDEKIVGMVSLDMIGYYTDEPNSQKSPVPPSKMFEPPTVGDFLGLGGVATHRWFSQGFVKAMNESEPRLKVFALDFLPFTPPDLLRSDHAPFLAAGVPAIILSTTAEMRYPDYHKPTDTIDKLDPVRFEYAVRAVAGATWRLAGPMAKPAPVLAPPVAKPKESTKKDATPEPKAP
jgi:Zn-dependent M28 family amino/carboxypeptidase